MENTYKNLIDYLTKESQLKYTEFRLVVRDGGDVSYGENCYIHVMDRNSETFVFSLKPTIKEERQYKLNEIEENIRDQYWIHKIEAQIAALETKYSVDSDWDSEIYQLKLLLK